MHTYAYIYLHTCYTFTFDTCPIDRPIQPVLFSSNPPSLHTPSLGFGVQLPPTSSPPTSALPSTRSPSSTPLTT